MKVFIDIFSNDEVLSDGFAPEIKDDCLYTLKSKMINPDDVGNVNIGCGNAFGSEEDQHVEEGVEKVNSVISNFSLEEYYGSKADVKEHFTRRIKAMKEKLADKPDQLKNWEKGGAVAKFVKELFGKFDDVRWFMGSRYGNDQIEENESMIIAAYWVDDNDSGETFFFFKDCLREQKV